MRTGIVNPLSDTSSLPPDLPGWPLQWLEQVTLPYPVPISISPLPEMQQGVAKCFFYQLLTESKFSGNTIFRIYQQGEVPPLMTTQPHGDRVCPKDHDIPKSRRRVPAAKIRRTATGSQKCPNNAIQNALIHVVTRSEGIAIACDNFFQRLVVPLSSKDIGYLSGDVQSKLEPYMPPLFDNLGIMEFSEEGNGGRGIQELLKENKLVITPLAGADLFHRGRGAESYSP
jgi:hypothetical protein